MAPPRAAAAVAAAGQLPPPRLTLAVVQGPGKGLKFTSKFGASEFTIGRIVRADFTVRDESVSSKHAEARWDAKSKAWTLVDVGSSNGTRLNGRAPDDDAALLEEGKPARLKVGDRIALGPETLVVVEAVEEEGAVGGGVGGVEAGGVVSAAPAAGGRRQAAAAAAAPAVAADKPSAPGGKKGRSTRAAGGGNGGEADHEDHENHHHEDDLSLLTPEMEDQLRAYAAAAQARIRAAAERAVAELRADWTTRRAALLEMAERL
jgi:hypothetical protein